VDQLVKQDACAASNNCFWGRRGSAGADALCASTRAPASSWRASGAGVATMGAGDKQQQRSKSNLELLYFYI